MATNQPSFSTQLKSDLSAAIQLARTGQLSYGSNSLLAALAEKPLSDYIQLLKIKTNRKMIGRVF